MARNHLNFSYGLTPGAVLVLLSVISLTGCSPKQVRTIGSGLTPSDGRISKEDLRQELDKFAELFRARLRQMSGDLEDRVPGRRTERTTLQMRARMVQALNVMLDREDSVVAFIETWALCSRFRAYLEEGEGAGLYGDGREIAVAGARLIETEIEQVGRVLLEDDVFEKTRQNMTEFANANPMTGAFSNVTVFATETTKGAPNPFMDVVKIPMAPLRAIEGVDRTASAVHRFTDTADRFSDILDGLPESSRWQLELLLYEFEEADMTKSFLESIAQISESSSRLSKSADELPQQLREQLSQFIEEADSKQENIQKTLEQAEKTTLAATNALEELDRATVSLGIIVKDVTETAQAWESAAKATGEVVQEFNKRQKASEGAQSFNINEYKAAAEQTSQAANDIERLLACADSFAGSRNLTVVINAVTWRAIGFVLFVFVLAVLWRIISIRLIAR